MKLAYWIYSGPAHIGTLRITSSFKNILSIMHAPLGDDYFNVMKSMLEKHKNFTKVTTSIVDRNILSKGSSYKLSKTLIRKIKEERPLLIIVTPTCTSSILQEDLKNFIKFISIETKSNLILADINHYKINEYQAADITLKQIVSFYLKNKISINVQQPLINIIGSYSLMFHNQHDIIELVRLLSDLNLKINLIIPKNNSIIDILDIPKAILNIVPYREIGLLTAEWLKKNFNMPYISTIPMGIKNNAKWLKEIELILKLNGFNFNFNKYIDIQNRFKSKLLWCSRSIDSQNFFNKKTVIFGDSTHSALITQILKSEMGFDVVLSGTYCKPDQSWFIKNVKNFSKEIIISDNFYFITNLISLIEPSVIFGTQMERHIGKKINIPCGIISTPAHIQNYSTSFKPFFGYEGTNQIYDLVYNSIVLGMEDHLLKIFGGHDSIENINLNKNEKKLLWDNQVEYAISNIPFFLRKKVKLLIYKYAKEKNINFIDLSTFYKIKNLY